MRYRYALHSLTPQGHLALHLARTRWGARRKARHLSDLGFHPLLISKEPWVEDIALLLRKAKQYEAGHPKGNGAEFAAQFLCEEVLGEL